LSLQNRPSAAAFLVYSQNPTAITARRFPIEYFLEIHTNLSTRIGISMDVETMATFPVSKPVPPRAAMRVAGQPEGLENLVDRAARGEVDAFEALYRENAGRVYLLCLRMCGDPSLAEELAQEAFIRAWQKLGSFRGDSAFSTWLHRVTVNVVLGDRRSTTRREARVKPAGDEIRGDLSASEPSPGQALDLERSIAALPDGARTVFVLHDVEGYRHKEIAHLTGIAEGTSKAQLHRARKLLRKALAS
jgi:RNA polymerase sigma-70 factor (ECF subfamily)